LCAEVALYAIGTLLIFAATPSGMLVGHWLIFGDLWPFWGTLTPVTVLPHGLGIGV
jgi:hypothetical protein